MGLTGSKVKLSLPVLAFVALILAIASVAFPEWVSVDQTFTIDTGSQKITSNTKGSTGLWQVCGSLAATSHPEAMGEINLGQTICTNVPLEIPEGKRNSNRMRAIR